MENKRRGIFNKYLDRSIGNSYNRLEKTLQNKMEIAGNESLVKWLKFILSPEKIGDEDMKENPELKQAVEEWDELRQDEREKELAELRMKYIRDQKAVQKFGYEKGLEKGMEKGIEKGSEKERQKMVKNMLSLDMPIEQIAQITGLTVEEIKKIKK